MKMICAVLLMVAAPVAASARPVVTTSASTALSAPVLAMTDATRNRQIAGIGATLARSVEPQIVYYWGETVSGRDTIPQWHKEWFAETGWRIEPGPIEHVLASDTLATLSSKMRYIKTAERQFLILMTYTLVKEAGGWKIARIQQTLLEGPQ